MKKFSLKAILMFCMIFAVAMVAMAAVTKVMVFSAPGSREVGTFNVGKVVHLEAINCLPVGNTVIVYRHTGDTTNTIATTTLTNGVFNGVITSSTYILAGDTIRLGGTYTSGVVRVIMSAD